MTLLDHLDLIDDPRSSINRQHELADILFLVLAALSCGMEGWADIEEFGHHKLDWLRQYRRFEHGIPTRHSIARIVKAVHIETVMLALFSWVNQVREQTERPLLAIDGKTLRSARRTDALHMVTAYDTEQGLVLFGQASLGKGHELATARTVLEMLNLKDSIVTLDALHCQTETLKTIRARKGDYVVQVKGNQPTLQQAIADAFAPHWANDGAGVATHHTEARQHGRQERRQVFQIPVPKEPLFKTQWPSVKSLIAVERERKVKTRTTTDTHYYLSSLDIEPELALKAVRQHWGIENGQHWVLDVVFKEDASGIGDWESAQRLAVLRRIVLNLVQQHPATISKRRKRLRALMDDRFRAELFFG